MLALSLNTSSSTPDRSSNFPTGTVQAQEESADGIACRRRVKFCSGDGKLMLFYRLARVRRAQRSPSRQIQLIEPNGPGQDPVGRTA